jgi:hypothetical protein
MTVKSLIKTVDLLMKPWKISLWADFSKNIFFWNTQFLLIELSLIDSKKEAKNRFKLSLYLPTVFRYPLAIIQWSFNIPKTKWKFNSRPFKRKQITFSFHMENRRIMFFHYQKFPISLSNNRRKKKNLIFKSL